MRAIASRQHERGAIMPISSKLLGVRIDFMDAEALRAIIEQTIVSGRQAIIGNHNLHSVYLYHRDKKMQTFYARADYVFADGMPLVVLGRLLGLPTRREYRITPIDWVPDLLARAAQEGWRVFLLGSKAGVALRAADILRRRYPELQVRTDHGYFDDANSGLTTGDVLAHIRDFRPHILCVGMGMPRQEHWILEQDGQTGANVTLSVGALMDLMAGELPVPPRWIGKFGLEWLFRLVSRPTQVWRRYLVEPWFLLPFLFRDVCSGLNRICSRAKPGEHQSRR